MTVKGFLAKTGLVLVAAYGVGIGIDYKLNEDRIKDEILDLRTQQVQSLYQKDIAKADSLGKNVAIKYQEKKNILVDSSLRWPYDEIKKIVKQIRIEKWQ